MGFRVINKTATSPRNVIVRLPYITRTVGVVREDLTIDVEAARAEEAELRKKGWVTAPHLIKGLPVPPAEQGFDPLPDGPGNQTQQPKIKETIGLDSGAQQAALAAETPAMNNSAESNKSIRKSNRGGRRVGAGASPKSLWL